MSLPGPRPSQLAAESSESAETITTTMASAPIRRPVRALEIIALARGGSDSGGRSMRSGVACAGDGVAAAGVCFRGACGGVGSSSGSPKLRPSKGSDSAPAVPAAWGSGAASSGGGGGGGEGASCAGGATGSSPRSNSRFPYPAAGFVLAGAGGGGGGAGASPVNSAMPKRSSASRRRAAASPLRTAAGRGAAGRGAWDAGAREAGRATGDAASVERSMVTPGGPSTAPEPGRRAWNTFLHEVQRTRTPLSVTFSSAMRNLDWQVGHWTTTLPFSRVLRLADKEMSPRRVRLLRLDTHRQVWSNGGALLRVKALFFGQQARLSKKGGVPSMSEQDQSPAPAAQDAPQGDKREPKVIKRYTNRKLYDTVESRYVTLDEIAQMIKGGAEVKIVDNRTKEDLTSVTLAQIIFEEEKKRSQMPLGVLREIIRHGGEAVAGFYQEKVGSRLTAGLEDVKVKTETLRENIEQRVRGVPQLLRREGEEQKSSVKEVISAGQTAVEELRAKVEESVKQALESFGSNTVPADVERLRSKLDALEKKLDELGK